MKIHRCVFNRIFIPKANDKDKEKFPEGNYINETSGGDVTKQAN